MAPPRRRRRRSGDVLAEYAVELGNELDAYGALVEQYATFDAGDELVVTAILVFGENREGVLTIFESVVVEDGRPHRRKYGYHFHLGGQLAFRYDRDAQNHPRMPEHKHVGGGRRVRWDRVTRADVVDELRDAVEQYLEEQRDAGGS